MRLHEYQAKQLLNAAGICSPAGFVTEHSNVVASRAKCMGPRLAVKAQVHAGNRGRLGAVRIVRSPGEAETAASALIGSAIGGRPGNAGSRPVRRVLVEEAPDVLSEKYIAFVLDRGTGDPLLLVSAAAGADVESARPAVFPLSAAEKAGGLTDGSVRAATLRMEFQPALAEEAGRMIRRLASFFFENECLLLEINPLAVTADSRLVALDAKIEFDDNALFRHPELASLRDATEEGTAAVGPGGVPIVLLGGDVGILANGAGLSMAVMDGLRIRGGAAANFLDIGGGASVEDVRAAVEWLLRNDRIRVLLVHIFGGIVRCDRIAEGMLLAFHSTAVRKPMVVRFEGTNSGQGLILLGRSGLRPVFAGSLGEAVETAVGIAASEGGRSG